MSEEETHHVNYTFIFVVLCVFTAISVLADVFGKEQLGKTLLASIVLGLATFKASAVLMYFMHMRFEGAWKYVLLGPTMVLAMAIPFTLAPDISFHYYNMQVPQTVGAPVENPQGMGHELNLNHTGPSVPPPVPAITPEAPAPKKPH